MDRIEEWNFKNDMSKKILEARYEKEKRRKEIGKKKKLTATERYNLFKKNA